MFNSDEQPPESPSDSNETDDTGKNLPWMRPILQLMNSFNYYCTHQNFCHPYCYRRHMRASTRLIKAVRKVSLILLILWIIRNGSSFQHQDDVMSLGKVFDRKTTRIIWIFQFYSISHSPLPFHLIYSFVYEVTPLIVTDIPLFKVFLLNITRPSQPISSNPFW